MLQRKKTSQSGRSMIEMLGVLAIVGVLSAGGIAGYSMAMQSYKTTQLIEKVNLIATRTRQVYKGDYTGIDSPQSLIDAGKISDANNPFGGTLYMSNVSSGTLANTFMIFTDWNLPAETCTDILTTDWGGSGVFAKINVNNGAYNFLYNDGTYPVPLANAISACQGSGKKITWWFK